MSLPPALTEAVDEVARAGRLLVGLDFDGTLAPFDRDPARARALPGAVDAVRSLAGAGTRAAEDTAVALVSGRSLEALTEVAGLSGLPLDRLVLVGSHGLETRWPDGSVEPVELSEAERGALAEAAARLGRLAEAGPAGAWVGRKPLSATLHTRAVPDAAQAEELEDRARRAAEGLPGVEALPGKRVVELTVRHGDKGRALAVLRKRFRADAVFYAGDDATDERAFAALRPGHGDLGVHVGDGETAAQFRVPGIAEVPEVLARLAGAR
jgi:trehalose 6-phosphate phosphatase